MAGACDTRPFQVGLLADNHPSLGFFAHHGFRHLMRTRLGTLDPLAIPTLSHPPPIASERLSGLASGVGAVSPGRPHPPSPPYRISPLPALTDLPGVTHKIATLHAEIYRQTHAWSPPAPITPTQAEAAFLGPDLIPDALFVALSNDTPVGVASLRHGPTPGGTDLGWTGVLVGQPAAPEITAALLHRCLSYASERGWTITIEVDEADHILWHLLDALPVTWEPDWLNLERVSNPRTRS